MENDAPTGDRYEIVVSGQLEPDWSNWFEGFTIEAETGRTRLTGRIVDQTALHGVLAKLRDLGIPIIAIERQATEPNLDDPAGGGNTPQGT